MPQALPLLSEEDFAMFFGNLKDIYLLHSYFLESLKKVIDGYHDHLSKISKPLMEDLFKKTTFNEIYTDYCSNYKKSDDRLK